MSLNNYLELEILDHIFGAGNRNYSSVVTVFVGLSSTDPTEDGTGITEVISANNGYARVPTTDVNWTAASGTTATLQNSTDIAFTTATSDWGIQSFFFLADQGSDGNYMAYATLTTSKDITEGDTAKFSAKQLTITLD